MVDHMAHDRPAPAARDSGLAKLLTIKDVAAHLSVSEKTIRRWIGDGSLVIHRLGRQIRVTEDDLGTFIKVRRAP